jgi:hypothetical protein
MVTDVSKDSIFLIFWVKLAKKSPRRAERLLDPENEGTTVFQELQVSFLLLAPVRYEQSFDVACNEKCLIRSSIDRKVVIL